MMFWGNPRYVKWTPAAARVGFEVANLGFIARMLHTHSSRDQNPWSWLILCLSLVAWSNFYRVCTPEQRIARVASIVAALTNFCVLAVVIYFRVR